MGRGAGGATLDRIGGGRGEAKGALQVSGEDGSRPLRDGEVRGIVVPVSTDPAPRRSQEGPADNDSNSSPSAKVLPTRVDSAGYTDNLTDDNTRSWFMKRNGATLEGALAFVPWVLQQAYQEGGLEEGQIVIHKGFGAVVFSDASGFTALTERLAKRSNGAELLSQCLEKFFTPLIDLINSYRGDVVKFSGDALMIYFQAFDDTKSPNYNGVVPPHGTYGLPDLGSKATAVLRASACCIEIHKRLHNFETGIDGVCLCLHIGVGCGEIRILQVGGEIPPETRVPRREYFIAGPPLEQISIAEPLAKNGETCLSPEAWWHVRDCVVGRPCESRPEYHLLASMDESKYTFPTIKHAAIENDSRKQQQFTLTELNIIRRYIPFNVFKQIECGTLVYVNEMRNISTIFIKGRGLDVMSKKGPSIAQELMVSVQKACYQHEGTLNKFLIDDKGMLFLLVFGLPPLVHTDDPTRAVLACFDMVKIFKKLELEGTFGVTTGRSYCGVCGSARRMEYTVLGDVVNLSARLMANAKPHSILCDEETKNRSSTEVIFNALAPIRVKGKESAIPVFQPVKKDPAPLIGVTPERKVRFPWYDHPFAGAVMGADSHQSNSQQMHVQQLCSVHAWDGIKQVQHMLGGSFAKSLHQGEQVVSLADSDPPSAKPPQGSPFAEGGVVVLAGPAGMGKTELAEHIVVCAARRLKMMPVFGTMGPRPGESARLAAELLRSSLGVFRMIQDLPSDDFMALQKLAPAQHQERLGCLKQAIKDPSTKERSHEVLEAALTVTTSLLQNLVTHLPVILVLQFEYGTSQFPESLEDQTIFWKVVSRLSEVVECEMKRTVSNDHKPLVMLIMCRDAPKENPAVQIARRAQVHTSREVNRVRGEGEEDEEGGSFVKLRGLGEESILEYMSNYLNVPEQMVPQALRQFVAAVTLGNPRHIRETIDQLLENCIQVHLGTNKQPKKLECKDIDKINISSWQHTAMVGETVCKMESLDPLEAAVLKMSTCFTGPFTLPDLAASTCSRWGGATYFDLLRLYKAIDRLVKGKLIVHIDDQGNRHMSVVSSQQAVESPFGKTRYFQTTNRLIRAVGSAMVLEVQKKSVKRQALIDRALWRELPARMEDLAKKRSAQHIPWYYEQAFRRGCK